MHKRPIFLAGIILAATALHAAPKTSQICAGVLPRQLREHVRSEFPGWRPKELSDLQSDDQQLWSNARPNECPGAVAGHFSNEKTVSCAILLVPESRPESGFKLLVSGNKPGHLYQFTVLDHDDKLGGQGMVISRVEPGKYTDFESTRSVRIKLDAINVEWLEKEALLYYWSEGRYQTLQTSD